MAPTLAEAIRRVNNEESISAMFLQWRKRMSEQVNLNAETRDV